MVKKALLIGINYINDKNNRLYGCVNDIEKVHKELLSKYDSVTKLFDEGQTDDKLQPTRKNIIHQINEFVKDTKVNDTLYFHYSAHGSHIKDVSGDERDGRDEVLCPSSGGIISDDELKKLLIEPLQTGVNIIVILDCCHSGTGADLRYQYRNVNQRVIVNRRYQDTKANVIMISGCRDNQTSADAWIREEKTFMGAMTFHFLKTLENIKREKRKPTLTRILKDLQKKLKKSRFSQVPQLNTGRNINIQITELKI